MVLRVFYVEPDGFNSLVLTVSTMLTSHFPRSYGAYHNYGNYYTYGVYEADLWSPQYQVE